MLINIYSYLSVKDVSVKNYKTAYISLTKFFLSYMSNLIYMRAYVPVPKAFDKILTLYIYMF